MTTLTTSKQLVLQGYQLLAARDFEGLGRLLHEDFVSHNPDIPAGRTAATEFLRTSPIAGTSVDVQHVVTEANLVAVHYLAYRPGEDSGRAVVDIWRVEGDLIAEHWDVMQP